MHQHQQVKKANLMLAHGLLCDLKQEGKYPMARGTAG